MQSRLVQGKRCLSATDMTVYVKTALEKEHVVVTSMLSVRKVHIASDDIFLELL